MKLQPLSKHFSDDSLIVQTGLLSTFSDNNGRLHFVSVLLQLCVILLCLALSVSFSLPLKETGESIFVLLKQTAESWALTTRPCFINLHFFCQILLTISWFIFFHDHYLIYFVSCTSLSFSFSLSFPLTFSCFVSRSPLPLCPPTWPRCFVSTLFSLTVSVAWLLCILRERTACLPSPNPRPLHNYGRPWQCTGQITLASSWRECWQARRGSRSLSILSRQWHGLSCHCDP